MRVYLDNAATTPLDPAVLEAMLPYWQTHFGNPSSIHTHGRAARAALEKARKQIAELLGAAPAEICFTSGGTEADNTALVGAVRGLGRRRIVTSPLEHHAVLHCAEALANAGEAQIEWVTHNAAGQIDLAHLESLLRDQPPAVVSLMHGNNEVGNLNDVMAIGAICQAHGALFHSDTVQTLGHYDFDLAHWPVDFVVGSAHKLHGPKGIGLLYVRTGVQIPPFVSGGAQERNQRGGTENVAGVVGLAKALELACANRAEHAQHIGQLKARMQDRLVAKIPGIAFNGNCTDHENSLYTVLNVSLPPHEMDDMLLFNLDIEQISASGGSACSSGSEIGSHVLRALHCDPRRGAVRFSFGRYNTAEEIDYVVDKLAVRYANAPV